MLLARYCSATPTTLAAATHREIYEAPAAAPPGSSGRVPTNSVAQQCAVPVD
jgi:hypothetical protein